MAESKNSRLSEGAPDHPVHPLETTLRAFFVPRLIATGARVCVALSGGRDSVVLLHALARLRASIGVASDMQLSALHVNHGISARAGEWAAFCRLLCQTLDVPLAVVDVEVPRSNGDGLEAAARHCRHGAFAGCIADWLALAHHRDDQAETVVLNLMRGAGVAGAAGMLAERPQASGPTLVRPLLEVSRALIEDYAAEHRLAWIDDESNDDCHFRRNFLRHEVMPRLEAKFSGATKSLARAAGHFAEAAQLLDELAAIDHDAAAKGERIGLVEFNALPPARARNLLRFEWLKAGHRAPDTRWMDEALKQLACADSLSELCMETRDARLHVYRGQIHIVGHHPPAPPLPVRWMGAPEVCWAGGRIRFVAVDGDGIALAALSGDACLRGRQGGERLKLHPKRPRRSLRNLLQEFGVPPWERGRLPFLWCGARLLWVGGLGVDDAVACAENEPGILPIWEP